MRILHTADWHLGRLFHQVSLIEDQRHVLWQIADYVQEHAVDVLLVSGDIYDRAVPPVAAVKLLSEFLEYLQRVSDAVIIMISGNHDSADRLGFGAAQLETAGLHIVSSPTQSNQPIIVERRGVSCRFFGIPYIEPVEIAALTEEPIRSHDEALAWVLKSIRQNTDSVASNIILAHCLVLGGQESESERLISVGGAANVSSKHFADFTYTALGHLHSPQSCGFDNIRYSGSPLKYSFSEHEQDKGVELLELNSDGLESRKRLPLIPQRDVRVLSGFFDDLLLADANATDCEDYLLIRLQDKRAILDAMPQLREVYPNVLQLEKPGIASQGEFGQPKRHMLKRGEFHMFRDFFHQMTNDELDLSEERALKTIIDAVLKGQDEVMLPIDDMNDASK